MIPRSPSFADFDRSYRRGLVLGLSLAELFLILVFLLLLATIGYWATVQEERVAKQLALSHAQARNQQLEEEKGETEARAGAAEEARDAAEEARDSAEEARKTLVDSLTRATTQALGNPIKVENPQELIVGLTREIERLETENDSLTRSAEIDDDVRRAARKAGVEPSDVPDIVERHPQMQRTIRELKKDSKKLRNQLDADKALSVKKFAGVEKGQNPPCWYVNDTKRNGEPYERGLYIFHVIIFDHEVFVKDIVAPFEFESQKQQLEFSRRALNRRLKFDEFSRSFQPLKDAGATRKVQQYPCKFYVKLWNATSTVENYRHAKEDVVEGVFYTYSVKNDPWPH